MKKWSYFLIALFTLSACEKEPLENPRVTDHQAILDAHTAFYDEVVANLIEGIRQHPDLEVEKLLAKDPEALLAELEARGILDRVTVEQAGAELYAALENAGYFDDADLRVEVDELLVENALAQGKKQGFGNLSESKVEAEVRLKNTAQSIEDGMGTPCYDAYESDMIDAAIVAGGCMLGSSGTAWVGCLLVYGYQTTRAVLDYGSCMNNK